MTQLSYPKTILDFSDQFREEEDCIDYLFKSQWPDGFKCPICGDRKYYYIESRRLFQCKSNKHQTYLTAGTVMHGTRLPLMIWFMTAYLMSTVKKSMSAIELQRQVGLKRYEPVFNMLHKLRASMVNPFRDKIGSVVEVDETYIGGPTTGGKRGRGTEKAIVIVAVEIKTKEDGKHYAGRIRLRQLKGISEQEIITFLHDNVKQGTQVISDSLSSYRNLKDYGYKHKMVIGSGNSRTLPIVHLVISNLKTWLKGTFHGVSKKHLQAYLNEYTFHFNRRFYPMAGFRTILGLSSKVEYPTYKGLYKGKWHHPNPEEKDVV